MNEVWKPVIGFESYQISNLGRLKRGNHFLNGTLDKDGYRDMFLCEKRKQHHVRLHRLVAQAFVPNPKGLDTVDHIDSDKTNNCADNLQWMSHRDNILKSHVERGHIVGGKRNKSGKKPGETLRQPIIQLSLDGSLVEEYLSMMDAERKTGINSGNISNCVNGIKKTAGGYIWRRKITPKGESEYNT